jgi:hypothetical protein
LWKAAFPYIHAEGTVVRKVGEVHEDDDDIEAFLSKNWHKTEPCDYAAKKSESSQPELTALAICGTKLRIPAASVIEENTIDDVVDGVLEDVIAVDYSPVGPDEVKTNGYSSDSAPGLLSPNMSRNEEITSLLLDAVWPEVVDTLRPLVRKVVKYSREHDIKYQPPPSCAGDSQSGGMGGDDFGGYMSDDSGW